ncbi:MAG: c-type cytochrome [Thermodesulfobacteriota bacterium]
MKIPPLLQFALLTSIAVIVFYIPGLFGLPLPASLRVLYIFFSVLMILLVLTVTDRGAGGLVMPVKRFIEAPGYRRIRGVVFIVIPFAAAFLTYRLLTPALEAPYEQRHVHPAPPASFRAYGKRFVIQRTVNPFRSLEKDDPAKFKEMVREGGVIYFKNCFYCHGARLDGRGHYARGLRPRPLPFKGRDTIAQLQESYLLWRIVKGGVGLPAESAPWNSAMPSWEETLTEAEVWKTILFLYDYTGNRPQEWE